MFVSVHHSES